MSVIPISNYLLIGRNTWGRIMFENAGRKRSAPNVFKIRFVVTNDLSCESRVNVKQ